MRTSADGEIALLDWEDVSALPGVCELAWLLVPFVQPDQWDGVIAAYGTDAGLATVLPAIIVQGLLSLSDHADGSAQAAAGSRASAAQLITCGNSVAMQADDISTLVVLMQADRA
jgi:hypothetical protein